MKVKTSEGVGDYRTLWWGDGKLMMIDQPKIPHEFKIHECKTYRDCAEAISTMIVRGAPAIGAAACYGMALAAEAKEDLEKAAEVIGSSRPTAYDLFHALEYFKENFSGGNAVDVAETYANDSAERCRMIGVHGAELIKDGMNVLTHCNAGALATVDWGTALAPFRIAKEKGVKFHVWVDETRPRCQGSRLTAWELLQEVIDHTVIADNTAGSLMRQGKIDLVIVGADRIAGNGDVANKIGTYTKAVLAKENKIPFYVAAPSSTFHNELESGAQIPIEERNPSEVSGMWGFNKSGKFGRIQIAPAESKCLNLAFDVTPAKYVTGYITEEGVD
ncbi:MAG TPA: S-methyl-5-thioribose-1-phosphate isomerase [Candidatus Altiarchaeales archaeon]|nr:S-methyl-5-thioribose-1-phosphate isomerase [Candidatus Altiarchaeales archaeon]